VSSTCTDCSSPFSSLLRVSECVLTQRGSRQHVHEWADKEAGQTQAAGSVGCWSRYPPKATSWRSASACQVHQDFNVLITFPTSYDVGGPLAFHAHNIVLIYLRTTVRRGLLGRNCKGTRPLYLQSTLSGTTLQTALWSSTSLSARELDTCCTSTGCQLDLERV
jgi:hypothetical protein